MNKSELITLLAKPSPTLSFEELQEIHQQLDSEIEEVQGSLDESESDFDLLNTARRDTAELVDAADRMRRSNSRVAHESMQQLLRHNLAKYNVVLPALENDEATEADPHKKEETEKAAQANKGLIQRMWDALKAFLAKIGNWIKQLFTKNQEKLEVSVQRAEKAEAKMEEAESDEALKQRIAAQLERTLKKERAKAREQARADEEEADRKPPIDLKNIAVQMMDRPAFNNETGHAALQRLINFKFDPAASSAALMQGMKDTVGHVLGELYSMSKAETVEQAAEGARKLPGLVRKIFGTTGDQFVMPIYDGVSVKVTLPESLDAFGTGTAEQWAHRIRASMRRMDVKVLYHNKDKEYDTITINGSFEDYTKLAKHSTVLLKGIAFTNSTGNTAIMLMQSTLMRDHGMLANMEKQEASLAQMVGEIIHEVEVTLAHQLVRFWKMWATEMHNVGRATEIVAECLHYQLDR